MISADELVLFVLVVESNSFSKAAKVAGISTPALSKKISKLEQRLSVQLLYRTTRKLTLTEAGSVLFEHAKGLNQQVSEAFGAVSNFGEKISGEIKISVPTISGELLLAEIIADFCQHYPEINVEMRLENHFADLVDDGLDLAIRTGELEDSNLIAKPLLTSHWVVCCSPSYLEKNGIPQSIEDLINHNCLAYTGQAKGAYDWRFERENIPRTMRISGNFSTNNAQALRKTALAGLGIIYVPKCSVHEDLEQGTLVKVLQQYKPRSLGVYAMYSHTRYLPLKIKLLIEYIQRAYQEKRAYF